MNHKNLCCTFVFLFLSIDLVETSIDQSKKSSINKFVNELEERIKIQKEFDSNTVNKLCTIFSANETDIGICSFLKMLKSLWCKQQTDEFISIVTVRYNNRDKCFDAKDHVKNFSDAILRQSVGNQDCNLHGDLSLTIDYIKQSDVQYFEILNTTAKQIREVHKKFNEMVIHNFDKISFAALKYIIICCSENNLHKAYRLHLGNSNQNDSGIAETGKQAFKFMTNFLKCMRSVDILHNSDAWEFNNQQSIFNIMRSEIVEYERNTGFEYFTKNTENLRKYFLYLVSCKHKEVLTQNIKDLALLYIPAMEVSDIKQMYGNIYVNTFLIINQNLQSINPYLMACTTRRPGRINPETNNINYFLTFRNFFRRVYSDDVQQKLKDANQACCEKLVSDIYSENVTRIIFNEKLSSKNIYKLCRILNDAKMFDDIHGSRIIYIDDTKAFTEDDINFGIQRYRPTRSELAIDKISFEIKVANTDQTDMKETSAWKLSSYRIKLSSDGNISLCMLPQQDFTLNKCLITLNTCEDPSSDNQFDDSINRLMSTCLEKNNSNVVLHHLISILNDLESVYIHIIYHTTNNADRSELITIVYDVQRADAMNDKKHMNRRIKCLDNVPTSFLDVLSSYLHFLQIRSEKFAIPNIVAFEDFDLVYIAESKDIELAQPTIYISEFVAKTYNCKIYWNMCGRFHKRDLIVYEKTKDYENSNIRNFYKKVGITEEELNKILYKFVIGETVMSTAAEFPYEIDKYSSTFEVDLFATHHADGSVILNICETKENIYNDKIAIDAYKVFAKISENKDHMLIINTIDYVLQSSGLRDSFVSLILNKLYKEASLYTTKYDCTNAVEDKYLDIIFDLDDAMDYIDYSCDEQMPDANMQISQSLYQLALRKLLDQQKIKHLIHEIIIYIFKITKSRIMKVTSVRITKTAGYGLHSTSNDIRSFAEDSLCENVEHLTCQKCQVHNQHQ